VNLFDKNHLTNCYEGLKCGEQVDSHVRTSLGAQFFEGIFIFPREMNSLGKVKISWDNMVLKQFFFLPLSNTKCRLDSLYSHHRATQFLVVWFSRNDSH
jgi:hypothetical protein